MLRSCSAFIGAVTEALAMSMPAVLLVHVLPCQSCPSPAVSNKKGRGTPQQGQQAALACSRAKQVVAQEIGAELPKLVYHSFHGHLLCF